MLARATVAAPLQAGTETAAVVFLVVPADAAAPANPSAAPAAAPVPAAPAPARGVEMLHGVAMEVTVELGRTRLSVRELLALTPGDVLELDRAAGSPADLLVNGRLIARGEVVVVDEDFALRVTEIVAHSAAV
jgi:flagellar motor switch protein FliN/FliY